MQSTSSTESRIFASENQVKEAFVDWTKYDGDRVVSSTPGSKIYLILNGELRYIPNPDTYNNLFGSWSGILVSDYLVDSVPTGPALSNNAMIVRGSSEPQAYLVTNNVKQWIPSMKTFEKFAFKQPTVIPQIVIDYVPTGPNIG